MASPRSPHRTRTLAIGIAVVLILGIPLLSALATLCTDYLWYVDVGQRGVFLTTLTSEILTGLAFGLAAFVVVYVNLRVARKMSPRVVLTSIGSSRYPQFEDFVTQMRDAIGPVLDKIALWGSLILAATIGLSMSGHWDTLRLALSGTKFGETDPQFGLDVGFFVFQLPALRTISDWLTLLLVITLILTALVHLLDGAIKPWARLKGFAPHVKAHLSMLLGLIVASKAFDYYLAIYELSYSQRGQVTGASYTDINAQLPALRILIAIAIISAVILIVNIRFKGWRLPAIALGVWIGAWVLVGGLYPALVQQFRVSPNEIAYEVPYIARNIAGTRAAFDLADVETRAFPAEETLTASDVLANQATLENVRLWDPSIAVQTYRQLQVIRTYYSFVDVDVDRYEIEGRQRQVLVSAREMDVTQLPDTAQTWVNQHLIYTHGYGLVVSPSNEADARGLPNFVVQDIPPTSVAGLEITQAGIYFGEATEDYVIVNSDIPEFDYPVGEGRVESVYTGTEGVAVSSFLRRTAFALRFSAPQILFSEYINSESRVLFNRDIAARVGAIAPFLTLDSDPYPAIVDGNIVWIIDAYTISAAYPYSEYFDGINYARNSVKVTVDAYDGTTTLWGVDPEDPVLQAWQTIFPELIASASGVPDAVRAHFRYPEDLFSLQAEVYKTYHMTDPQDFYNKEDAWEIPGERENVGMDPFYVLMQLPGEDAEDFQMIQPFTPRNRDNMIGWMAVKSDPLDYGTRVVYEFPKQRVILGPKQVEARINQDDVIAPQLTLWSQRGSSVIFGNMLVIPLDESIVYIQPLYLQAEQTAIPELVRVIVVYADKVEMADDLSAALLAVFGEQAPDDGEPGEPGANADVARALELYEAAIAAQRAGDWAAYGKAIDELGAVLEQLTGTSTVEPSVEGTGTP